jgi:hypothetical protein
VCWRRGAHDMFAIAAQQIDVDPGLPVPNRFA